MSRLFHAHSPRSRLPQSASGPFPASPSHDLRWRTFRLFGVALVSIAVSGCLLKKEAPFKGHAVEPRKYLTEIEQPDLNAPSSPRPLATAPPISLANDPPATLRDITLQEAIQTALANSPVLRDVGGLLLKSPESVPTAFGPAIIETDPRFGVEAALSAFDANFAAGAFFQKNDRPFNNTVSGLGTQLFQQDLNVYNLELRKQTAVGTTLALRNRFDYDFNNSPFNNDPNLPWGAIVEGELRQPLLQGAGVEYNRIAGPNAQQGLNNSFIPYGAPGFYNGVLIARINTDVSLADFESAVTQMVSDVENAYWELYFAYRDLDAKIAARNRAHDTWSQINVLVERGPGGQLAATAEAQAREQLYRLSAEVQDALAGRVPQKTTSNSLRGAGGVYAAERSLRRAIGLPAADGVLLRPADEPSIAQVKFSWEESLSESLIRRVELRRQRWQIKRRELELLASRNFLLPRLDVVSLYRFRGLGHDLIGNDDVEFGSAIGNLTTGDFQEWALGAEMVYPIGSRQGHSAVRNAELKLSRERVVLVEQEEQVVSDLSNAVAETDRAYLLAMTNYNRRIAALRQAESLAVLLREADLVEKPRLLDLQLEAQRRLADAESQYYRALAEHAVAIKNVHLEKGSLLDYNEIYLSEGMWPRKAYWDANRRARHRIHVKKLDNYILQHNVVSGGPFPQELDSSMAIEPLPPPAETLPVTPAEPLPAPLTGAQ